MTYHVMQLLDLGPFPVTGGKGGIAALGRGVGRDG